MKRLVGHNQSIQAMARDAFAEYEGWTGPSPMTTVIDTPNGFIASDSIMHYYVKDYQGNVRQVVNADGVVEQDNHYYPYGMLMGESSNILASARGYKSVSFNPYLFGSKEYLTTASANLLDFTARTYDPATLFFLTPDPLSEKFTSYNGYLYCMGNPIVFTDFNGLMPQWWDDYSISTRLWGLAYTIGGYFEVASGLALAEVGIGVIFVAHGGDVAQAGFKQLISGEETRTITSQLLQAAGVSQETANYVDAGISMLAQDPIKANRAFKGSARLDIVVFDKDGKIVHIFDIITGGAKLTDSQIQKFHNQTKSNVSVSEIHIQ